MLRRLFPGFPLQKGPRLRLVTWNCAMALRNKWAQLLSLAPDVAVIQECEQPERWPAGACTSFVWDGSNPHKGLAILTFGPWRVEACAQLDPTIQFVLPARISGPKAFNILGVWTKATADRQQSYSGQMRRAAQVYSAWLASEDAVVMGDWNSNAGWYKSVDNPHTETVAQLHQCGLTSACHTWYDLPHGAEQHATWYNHKRIERSFHLGYCFIPQAWTANLHRVTVGRHGEWMAYSDH